MGKNWLNNKTVIISGASGGIGFNVAKLLIEKYNCKIIGIARNEDKIKNAINSLPKDLQNNFTYTLFDVSVKENWINFANKLKNDGVKYDVLINNAGFMHPFITFDKLPIEEIDEIVNTNFLSVVYSTKYLIDGLKNSSTPAIINISSAAGMCAVVGESMYCATKFAVKGFTETLIQDYKGKIYVAGVYPGFIKTNILNRMTVTDKNNKLISHLMMPVEKAAKKIVKKMAKKRKRICMGFDGRSMNVFTRFFPRFMPNTIRKVLKISKLELFDEVFDENKEKRR